LSASRYVLHALEKILFSYEYEGISISDYLKDETRDFIVIKILESLPKAYQHVFVFDEIDRIENLATKTALADTVKHFSDYPQNITIVIVGVGCSIEELSAHIHRSSDVATKFQSHECQKRS